MTTWAKDIEGNQVNLDALNALRVEAMLESGPTQWIVVGRAGSGPGALYVLAKTDSREDAEAELARLIS